MSAARILTDILFQTADGAATGGVGPFSASRTGMAVVEKMIGPVVDYGRNLHIESERLKKRDTELSEFPLVSQNPRSDAVAAIRQANQSWRRRDKHLARTQNIAPPPFPYPKVTNSLARIPLASDLEDEEVGEQAAYALIRRRLKQLNVANLPGYCGWHSAFDVSDHMIRPYGVRVAPRGTCLNGPDQGEAISQYPVHICVAAQATYARACALGNPHLSRFKPVRVCGSLVTPVLTSKKATPGEFGRVCAMRDCAPDTAAFEYACLNEPLRYDPLALKDLQGIRIGNNDHVVLSETQAIFATRVRRLKRVKTFCQPLMLLWHEDFFGKPGDQHFRHAVEQLFFNAWHRAAFDKAAQERFKKDTVHSLAFREAARQF